MKQNEKKQLQKIKLNSYIRDRVQKKLLTSGTTEKYIRYCTVINEIRKDDPNTTFERHHILPKHAGETNAPENLALLTCRQHILVHLLRYLELGQKQDFLAYVLRNASKDVDLRSHGKRMAEFYRQNGLFFFDSNFQSKQGKKGGKKGGSANTKLQQEARSKVGKVWGPKVGLLNQSNDLKTALSYHMIFHHEKENVSVIIPPMNSAAELFDYLHNEVVVLGKEHLFPKEFVTKAKGGGAMYNLIRGKKKRIYGWVIIDCIDLTQIFDD